MKNNQFCRLRSQCVPYTMGFLDVMLHILRHWRTFFSFIIDVIRGHFFDVIRGHFFNAIRGLFFNVIRGLRAANLDYRISSGNDSKVECVTSGNDRHWGRLFSGCKLFNYPSPDTTVSTSPARGEVLNNITFKGLDVVRQYAALLERRVQSSTRVRKAQAVTRQTNPIGRSMIEMLGVLAIIGVLSVGGIAGYSKAMTKFKINKAIDEINTIVSNTKIIFANSKTITAPSGVNFFDPEIIEEDFEFMRNYIMPKETDTGVKNKYGGNMFQSPFGGEIYADPMDDGIIIYLSDLPREACIALGSYDWKDARDVSVSKNDSIGGGGAHLSSQDCRDYLTSNYIPSYDEEGIVGRCKYNNDILPMSPDLAAKGCSCTSNTCQFSVMFP